ncbi:MAG: hypothetical protein P1V36_02425 [Planctomycetota bacterium]|nr:hypothetical protein [Planctomycetota bacterium]
MSVWHPVEPVLPASFESADLFWWRTGTGMRTVVSLLGGMAAPRLRAADQRLRAVWFDASGTPGFALETVLDHRGMAYLDSAALSTSTGGLSLPEDALLAVFALSEAARSAPAPEDLAPSVRASLYGLVDWVGPGGSATLHSDQALRHGLRTRELTEVVLVPEDGPAALVFLNGAHPQPAKAFQLELRAGNGAVKRHVVAGGFAPWSVNRIPLGSAAALAALDEGRPLLATGRMTLDGMHARPYVVQQEGVPGAYHAGDRYPQIPARSWQEQVMRGCFNPVAVWQDAHIATIANLLHSQGAFEEDAWVGVRLFDESGKLVRHEDRWVQLRRHQLVRRNLGDLLPPGSDFRGHAAFHFSEESGTPLYPPLLQVLAEYRSDLAPTRTMLWSDDWNSPLRQHQVAGVSLRSFFRVWWSGALRTTISISTAGPAGASPGYQTHADSCLVLTNLDGEELVHRASLGPHESHFLEVGQLGEDVEAHLAPRGYGMVVVESPCDLAMLQFTRHEPSGSLAVEHLMAAPTLSGGQAFWPAGG